MRINSPCRVIVRLGSVRNLPVYLALALFVMSTSPLEAHSLLCGTNQDSPGPSTDQPTQTPTPDVQDAQADQLRRQWHTRAQTARTSAELTDFINEAHRWLEQPTNSADRQYLESLLGWALSRRGRMRLDLSEELARVGNQSQSDVARGRAVEDLHSALEYDPNSWRTRVALSAALARESQWEQALQELNHAAQVAPQQSLVWFNRGEINSRLARYDEAVSDYDRALKLAAGDLPTINGRGLAHLESGNAKAALTDFEAVLRLQPTNPWALLNRGDAHRALGRWQDAYDDYVKATESQPSGAAYRRAAWLSATAPDEELFRPHLAQALAEKAIELEGETAETLDTMAVALAALGDFDAAVQHQRRAVEIAGQSPSNSMAAELTARLEQYQRREPFYQ